MESNENKEARGGLMLAALGIVFGDIGTSPLYAFKEAFMMNSDKIVEANVFGVLSLIVWSMVLVICVKYALFIMRAENGGEGGSMALMALLSQKFNGEGRKSKILVALGLFATALFFGDGAITPAISVLSAVEGLEVANPEFAAAVVPVSCVIIAGLFFLQKRGTATVGVFFGPVMILWFGILALTGMAGVAKNPNILLALSPHWAVNYFLDHGAHGILILGAVILSLTGVEALYADMGHFGRRPIIRAWYLFVFPSLLMNYFGQGAMILLDPEAAKNPFFSLCPDWALIPFIGLATLATVIASQAVISGVFSMTNQAIALGYLPRMKISHTSDREIGQIYIPAANYFLFVAVLTLILVFRSSNNLSAAYGLAVNGAMFVDTILAAAVFRFCFGWKFLPTAIFATTFAIVDLAYLTANFHKLFDGGWLPLVIGACLYLVMDTWKKGRLILRDRAAKGALPLSDFIDTMRVDMPHRVDGTAIFMHSNRQGIPPALLHNLRHNQVLHSTVVILTVETLKKPYANSSERLSLTPAGEGFWRGTVYFGFREEPNVPKVLRKKAGKCGLKFDSYSASFFLNRENVVSTAAPSSLPRWREMLFVAISHNAGDAAAHFQIPSSQVVELGARVEI